jgi:hypothetical protein
VYWLYEESLERVGLAEHSKLDHAVMHLLWYYESDFATFLQEEGWTCDTDIWSVLPRRVVDRCIDEEWASPMPFLERCLAGPVRIVTPEMLRELPTVYTCTRCGQKSLTVNLGCTPTSAPLDFPDKTKIFFVDRDMIVHTPPRNSTIWGRLGIMPGRPEPDDDSSPEQLQPVPR